MGKLPPHSLEAEQGVLGCVLLSPNDSLTICIERFKSASGMVFYDLRHRTIYEAAISMYQRTEPIDLITLQAELVTHGVLEGVGGLAYVASLPDAVPSAANLEHYLSILMKKYALRAVIQKCSEIIGSAEMEPGNVDDLVAGAHQSLQVVMDATVVTTSFTAARDLINSTLDRIELMHNNAGVLTGLSTGFADLDKVTWGLHPGEMVVLAARPSVGKTSLAMNMAEHISTRGGLPVGVFSLEMDEASLMMRMLCSRARVNLHHVRNGWLGERDFQRLSNAADDLRTAPIYIDDTSGLSILQLRAKARRMHQMHGIKAVFIDYMQLMTAQVRRTDNRQQEVSEISRGCKALAKDLKVPVVVLSQLKRTSEDRGPTSKPKLSDLRESGSIEQDADVVALMSPDKTDEHDRHGEAIPIDLEIAKNRNGPTGMVRLVFLRGCTRFEDAARVQADDVPQTQLLPYSD